jgi:hypothetical protein
VNNAVLDLARDPEANARHAGDQDDEAAEKETLRKAELTHL